MSTLDDLAAMLGEPPSTNWDSIPGINNPLHNSDYLRDNSVSLRQLGRGLIRDMTELRDYLLNRVSPIKQMVDGLLRAGLSIHHPTGQDHGRGFTHLREVAVDAFMEIAHLVKAGLTPSLWQLVFTRTAAAS